MSRAGLALPPVSLVRRYDTHRLIPSQYSEPGSVLGLIADDAAHLADLFDRPERIVTLPNDLATVQAYIRRHARIGTRPCN